MFGNSVTELSQTTIGLYGYTVRADTTSILASHIVGIQTEASSGKAQDPVTIHTDLSVLMGYVNSPNCPSVAYSDNLGEIYMFFKTLDYPYLEDTRFVLLYQRNPLKMLLATDTVDIIDSDMELFMAYAIKHACQLLGDPIPYLTTETIRLKEDEIRNANS